MLSELPPDPGPTALPRPLSPPCLLALKRLQQAGTRSQREERWPKLPIQSPGRRFHPREPGASSRNLLAKVTQVKRGRAVPQGWRHKCSQGTGSMPAVGSAGGSVGVQGTVWERARRRMTQYEGAGGGVLRSSGKVRAHRRLPAQAPSPLGSPRRPGSPDSDARARGMRGAGRGVRVRGAARWPRGPGVTRGRGAARTRRPGFGRRCLGRGPASPHLPPRRSLGRPSAPASARAHLACARAPWAPLTQAWAQPPPRPRLWRTLSLRRAPGGNDNDPC